MPPATPAVEQSVLQVRDLEVEYGGAGRKRFRAVHGVSFEIGAGETLGLVGESGCGKSSTGRAVVQLPPPSSGSVQLRGQELVGLRSGQMRPLRQRLQMIFQDPIASLNPRRTALEIVAEPLGNFGIADPRARAMQVLEEVGVDEAMAQRRPHQLSGGQCQRISIARSLALDPDVIVCDEPVSALDVSVQAQVLNLLETMKERYRLSMLFISHDLAVVSNISDRVAVMYLGALCEIAPSNELYSSPRHHYTRLLLDSIPDPTKERITVRAPSAARPSQGCRFAPRCPAATEVCWSVQPALVPVGAGREVACHNPL